MARVAGWPRTLVAPLVAVVLIAVVFMSIAPDDSRIAGTAGSNFTCILDALPTMTPSVASGSAAQRQVLLSEGNAASRERAARELLTSIEGVLELLPYLFALGDRRRVVPAAAPAVAAGGRESPVRGGGVRRDAALSSAARRGPVGAAPDAAVGS